MHHSRACAAIGALLLLATASCAAAAAAGVPNPLLTTDVFPHWDQIKPEHVAPAVKQLLAEEAASLELLEKDLQAAGANVFFERVFKPFSQIRLRMDFVYGQIDHLTGVANSPELRAASESVTPERVAFELRFGQSKPIYAALKALKTTPALWDRMSAEEQRLVNITYNDMTNSGVGLSPEDRKRFNKLAQELSQLSIDFSNNVLDSTADFKLLITDKAALYGLSDTTLAVAAQNAAEDGHAGATMEAGPWLLKLDDSTFASIIQFAHNRELRERFFKAHSSVASSGETDNTPLVDKILAKRRELAALLGYKNWAEYRFTGKMATFQQAYDRMQQLVDVSRPAAARENEQLTAFARNVTGDATLELKWWDWNFWSEQQKEALFNLRAEVLREYLPVNSVLAGLFKLIERMYGISIAPVTPKPAVWDDDVTVFQVSNKDSPEPIAYVYFDLFARPGTKNGGAWENSIQSRSRFWRTPSPAAANALHSPASGASGTGDSTYSPRLARVQAEWLAAAPAQLPLVFVVCNQDPPAAGKPGLMTMADARTLFHEMGHALMDVLAASKQGLTAGNRNVEIDAIETPSQMQEKWVYDPATFNSFARHWKTGAPVPEAMFKQISAVQKYRAGYAFTRQLTFALTDLRLHSDYVPGGPASPHDVYLDTYAKVTPMAPFEGDQFLNDFRHIFSGGYEAGYYSYMWADTMSADIFEAFVDAGMTDAAITQLGGRFRDTFLSLGGSEPPAQVFRKFMGREPEVEAMLKYNGLLAQS